MPQLLMRPRGSDEIGVKPSDFGMSCEDELKCELRVPLYLPRLPETGRRGYDPAKYVVRERWMCFAVVRIESAIQVIQEDAVQRTGPR